MPALNTDLYELTMAAAYWLAGKQNEIATFELSVRRLPERRNFLVSAGLEQALDYLQNLRFEASEIDYLRSLPQFAKAPAEFFQFLGELRFQGDLFALPEGTPFFASEPLAIVRAPIIQAQLVETYLLSTFAFQTSIASKAARCVIAAEGRPVVEFGSRRAHGPDAGVLAGRAAFIGGCAGTSNTESGMRFGIPVSGTAAHSWTMSFDDEEESFRALQRSLGDNTVFLLDTYDTIEAAHIVTRLDGTAWGVRLDSGDLVELSKNVRSILDRAGLQKVKIFATNDLDEHRIAELVRAGAPIDAFGVGTQLATSADAPSLSVVYKMVELRRDGGVQYTAKFSDEKSSKPGAKQVFRYESHDVLALQTECISDVGGEPLVRPVLIAGKPVEPRPSITRIQERARKNIEALPRELFDLDGPVPYDVAVSRRLEDLTETVRDRYQATVR